MWVWKKRRVVVTGVGAVTPSGNDVATSWSNLIQGKSGIGPLTRLNPDDFPAKVAGEVKDFGRKNTSIRKMSGKWTGLLIMRSRRRSKRLKMPNLSSMRIMPIVSGFGSVQGIGGIETIENQHKNFLERGYRRVLFSYRC